MNFARPRPCRRCERGRAGRFGWALVSATLFAAGTVLAAPRAGAATLTTKGLVRVRVSSFQALPPPYEPRHAVLKSAVSLGTFVRTLRADHIGTTSHPTSANGCSGGIEYTVVMTYNNGRRTSLDAYNCGGSITGKMTGNVENFEGFLSFLMPL